VVGEVTEEVAGLIKKVTDMITDNFEKLSTSQADSHSNFIQNSN